MGRPFIALILFVAAHGEYFSKVKLIAKKYLACPQNSLLNGPLGSPSCALDADSISDCVQQISSGFNCTFGVRQFIF